MKLLIILFLLKLYAYINMFTENAGLDKYSYSGYGIELDSRSFFLFPNFEWH